MSAPAVQDASWLSYSCRMVILRGRGGGEGRRGGGRMGCEKSTEVGAGGGG